MKLLRLWTKDKTDFTTQVDEPIRPFALSYLAASGMFDKIVLADGDGGGLPPIVIEGSGLLRAADMVKPVNGE